MNKVTQERVAEKVLRAISDEKLLIKEAGHILGINPSYFSMIKKDTYYDKMPKKAWEALIAWADSGAVKIKGYHANNNIGDPDLMVPDLKDNSKEEKSKKNLFLDLSKAKYGNPEKHKKEIREPLPPIVQEAKAKKTQRDHPDTPLIQDIILNVKIKLNLSIE